MRLARRGGLGVRTADVGANNADLRLRRLTRELGELLELAAASGRAARVGHNGTAMLVAPAAQ